MGLARQLEVESNAVFLERDATSFCVLVFPKEN